jgi:hypothetical protein
MFALAYASVMTCDWILTFIWQVFSENSTFVKSLDLNRAENISALSIEMEET